MKDILFKQFFNNYGFMKKTMFFIMALLLACGGVSAQTVVSDTVRGEATVQPQPTDDHYRVVTNRFWDNWFVFGEVGGHAFAGDYGSVGDFDGLLSPDFRVGFGKWFTPGIGVKFQFGMGNSKGYSKEETMFVTGDQLIADDGTPYWKTKIKWLDFSVNAMFNLSRLFCGYEGKDSKRLMNQFIASVGLGALHHYDIAAQRNEWSGHFELQYSRFFSRKKDLSLDVKAHATLYQTNFDAVTLKGTGEDSHWFDANVGLSVGLTYYFKKRHWDRCLQCEEPVYITNTVLPEPNCPEYKTMVFYVFFPNNYSGRDDAPIVSGAPVNAVDYLASGVFTQRKFADTDAVESALASGRSLSRLETEDVPTEKANKCEADGVARGYEMSSAPISLDVDAASMNAFKDKQGYYYAPIYSGGKTWYYRVDDETATQSLMSSDNYKESTSYGLNAHSGLDMVKSNMTLDDDVDLYSFADVYAAVEGNGGVLANSTDAATVAELKNIFENGRIQFVSAEGLATSQDNYSGDDAENVGLERNKTLAYNRARTVIQWLKDCGVFRNIGRNCFSLNALTDPIGVVNDPSTRGLNAKLNRCVKVRISYVIEKQ